MITKQQFEKLRDYAFSADNRGYQPTVIEAPNGDHNWDTHKRYAHVAPKYGLGNVVEEYELLVLFARLACESLGIPPSFWPVIDGDCTIRVLHYPPGASSAPHTDLDMFTLCLRRDVDAFRYLGGECAELTKAREFFPGIHFGELITEIMGCPATRHEVVATDEPQNSAVLFVMPPLDAVLPSGLTVRAWLDERKSRSRARAAT